MKKRYWFLDPVNLIGILAVILIAIATFTVLVDICQSQEDPLVIAGQQFGTDDEVWSKQMAFGDLKDFLPPDVYHPHGLCEAAVFVTSAKYTNTCKLRVRWSAHCCPPEADGKHKGMTFAYVECHHPKYGLMRKQSHMYKFDEGVEGHGLLICNVFPGINWISIHAEVVCRCGGERCGVKWTDVTWVKHIGLVQEEV